MSVRLLVLIRATSARSPFRLRPALASTVPRPRSPMMEPCFMGSLMTHKPASGRCVTRLLVRRSRKSRCLPAPSTTRFRPAAVEPPRMDRSWWAPLRKMVFLPRNGRSATCTVLAYRSSRCWQAAPTAARWGSLPTVRRRCCWEIPVLTRREKFTSMIPIRKRSLRWEVRARRGVRSTLAA